MFENAKIDIRVKLASLWTALIFLYVYADYFDGLTSSTQEMVKNLETPLGPLTPELLLLFSVITIVPSSMIFLSIFLKPKINRILNMVIPVLWSSMSVLLFVDTINSDWHKFYALFQFVEFIILIIIIYQAYKWPKKESKFDS
ncbi:MAG: DUF6326 family protein [Flavobacteriaceae bacterium]